MLNKCSFCATAFRIFVYQPHPLADIHRRYYNIPAWRRIEQQLSETLGAIVSEKLHDPEMNTEALLHQHLDPLARRLNAMMYS